MTATTTAPRERRLGDFQLLAKLATGGMAEIFLARRVAGGPMQVVKRILPHLADDEHFVTMFRDEANLAAQLVHPNICRVHELGHVGDVWFIVMEYLHGIPLSRLLSRLAKDRKFLDVRIVAGLMVQACDGLDHAHDARGADGHHLGLVHRDVSPPNILVTADGTVKLLDFGIAKARGANSKTRTGTVKGKNAYMSPEQILGKPLDRRSDVFALATVMYELCAVRRLFHRDSDFLTFKAITEEAIPDVRDRRPDLPASLVAVLVRALARDPAARFPTAAAMRDAIVAAMAPLGGPASPSELAAMLTRDFASELADKDALVGQAERLGADAAPLAGPGATNAPTPVASIRALAEDDGSFFDRTPVAKPPRPASVGPSDSVVVEPTAGLAPAPAGLEMLDLAPGSTDLLRERRRRVRRLLLAGVALTGLAVIAMVGGARACRTAAERSATEVAAVAPPPPPVDAAPPPDAAVDADQSRADILALARYGFFSVGADKPTEIWIDHRRVGPTPLIRYPLSPGPHDVKAVGPRGKTKRWKILIEATKDVDAGVLDW